MYRKLDAEDSNVGHAIFESAAQLENHNTPGVVPRERDAVISSDINARSGELVQIKTELRILAEVEANQTKRNLALMKQLREAVGELEDLRTGMGVHRLVTEVTDLKDRLQTKERFFKGRVSALEKELHAARIAKTNSQKRVEELLSSTSWKITRPIRRIKDVLRGRG